MTRVNYDSGTISGPKALTQKQLKKPQVAAPSMSYREQFWWPQGEPPADTYLTELIPSHAPGPGPNFILRVMGVGFTETSEIYWNNGAEPTTFVSPNELQTVVQAMTASGPGAIEVVVMEGVATNKLTFNFT